MQNLASITDAMTNILEVIGFKVDDSSSGKRRAVTLTLARTIVCSQFSVCKFESSYLNQSGVLKIDNNVICTE